MDSVGTGEGEAAPACLTVRGCCVAKSLGCVSHSFKIQTLEACLVDGLSELLFIRIIKG